MASSYQNLNFKIQMLAGKYIEIVISCRFSDNFDFTRSSSSSFSDCGSDPIEAGNEAAHQEEKDVRLLLPLLGSDQQLRRLHTMQHLYY